MYEAIIAFHAGVFDFFVGVKAIDLLLHQPQPISRSDIGIVCFVFLNGLTVLTMFVKERRGHYLKRPDTIKQYFAFQKTDKSS